MKTFKEYLNEESELSNKQQKYIDKVEKELKNTKYFSVGPNLECPICREPFEGDMERGIEEQEQALKYDEITRDEYENNIETIKEEFEENVLNNYTEFTAVSCDICHTLLAGERQAAHSVDDNDELIHYDICRDCYEYIGTEGDFVPEDENLLDNGTPGWPDNE